MHASRKIRLDRLLVERGLAESRERAQRLIRAGQVRSGDRVLEKPGLEVPGDAALEIKRPDPYVSRGGHKLAGAIEAFEFSIRDRVAADIGASTGGFTDCLLQHGASLVYAVDVGKGQLHWRLRRDPRVRVMEGINARRLDPASFAPRPSLAAVDVSFISLQKILPAVKQILTPGGDVITLIKPQFEAGRAEVGRGGVVRDETVHRAVVDRIRAFGTESLGWTWCGCAPSPIRGPAGNLEFLAHWNCP